MTRKKSDYVILFEELYDLYKSNGDNDATWSVICTRAKAFIDKALNGSPLWKEHFVEGKQNVMIAIMNAFRTYDIDKGASVYTWTYMLAKQAICRTIKEQTKLVKCDYLEEIEIDMLDRDWDPEEIYSNRQFFEKENQLRQKLTKLLGGPIEADVFILKNGLFDCAGMSIDEISEETRLSKRTIYQLNIKINKIMKKLRNDEDELKKFLQC